MCAWLGSTQDYYVAAVIMSAVSDWVDPRRINPQYVGRQLIVNKHDF